MHASVFPRRLHSVPLMAHMKIFLLGFLIRGLRRYGLAVALGASLLVRVLYHTYQGPLGAMWVLVFGAVLSVYFIESGKLFPAVVAHAIADVAPFLWR
jgi:membrane protease YdiL (CAAX protease family)